MKSERIVSIDIFRGVTMAVMIFVNALSDSQGLPWWTFHAHADQDAMTYVDMVFPFFLFAVGLSMPFAIERRLVRYPSQARLWIHIVTRAASLVVLGLILANADRADAAQMGMPGALWALAGLVCCSLYLNVYPRDGRLAKAAPWLKWAGLAGVAVLVAIFRSRTRHGEIGWLQFGYPEILGLIGLTYLGSAILYVPTRKWPWAQWVWCAALTALCALSTARVIPFPGDLNLYVWPWSNGALCALVMAGVITSSFFFSGGVRKPSGGALARAAGFAALTGVAGLVLCPLGISKIRATPSWSLWSIAAAVVMFMALYWICDMRQKTGWAAIVRPAGNNTLTTYLLPDVWIFLTAWTGFTYYDTHWTAGSAAVVKTLAFTLVMLGLAALFTRARVRLQL